jgi:hypothetical protein
MSPVARGRHTLRLGLELSWNTVQDGAAAGHIRHYCLAISRTLAGTRDAHHRG